MVVAGLLLPAPPSAAQVTPANPLPPPPDDAPSVRVGGTLFLDYSYVIQPKITDADGNAERANAFNIGRAYLNVTGQVNHLIAFRVTPDIAREAGTGSSLTGSMTVRLKYGYAQLNLDDWLWRGAYVRVGMTQTPYVEFEESIYRYRFQGPVFVDREAYLTSSDFGAAVRTLLPRGYGEVVGGVYNGEGYQRTDPNGQKALQLRGTLRPLPGPGPAHGLRVTLFYDADHYVRDAERTRFVSLVSYEHRFLNAGWVYLGARDRTTIGTPVVESSGHSLWAVPRFLLRRPATAPPTDIGRSSVEGLFRYDRLEPNHATANVKTRWLAGVAFWPRMAAAGVSSAVLLDYETVAYHDFAPARPTEKRIALHLLVAF